MSPARHGPQPQPPRRPNERTIALAPRRQAFERRAAAALRRRNVSRRRNSPVNPGHAKQQSARWCGSGGEALRPHVRNRRREARPASPRRNDIVVYEWQLSQANRACGLAACRVGAVAAPLEAAGELDRWGKPLQTCRWLDGQRRHFGDAPGESCSEKSSSAGVAIKPSPCQVPPTVTGTAAPRRTFSMIRSKVPGLPQRAMVVGLPVAVRRDSRPSTRAACSDIWGVAAGR
jgi:hypothetical protein